LQYLVPSKSIPLLLPSGFLNLPFPALCGNIPLYHFAPFTILNALVRLSAFVQTHLLVSTMGHKAQLSADVVTNVAFGLTGVVLTIFMICQAARYTASRNHYPRRRSCSPLLDHNSPADPG
jgi:hypothetical protein